MPSISRLRPSMKACRSLAAANSAFSRRSPWARASSMSLHVLGALDLAQVLELVAQQAQARAGSWGDGHWPFWNSCSEQTVRAPAFSLPMAPTAARAPDSVVK